MTTKKRTERVPLNSLTGFKTMIFHNLKVNILKSQMILLCSLLGIGCNIHSIRVQVASIQFETNITLSNNLPHNDLTIRDVDLPKQKTSSGNLSVGSSRGIFSTVIGQC